MKVQDYFKNNQKFNEDYTGGFRRIRTKPDLFSQSFILIKNNRLFKVKNYLLNLLKILRNAKSGNVRFQM